MSQSNKFDPATSNYLEQLKAEGAELLLSNPQYGSSAYAKLLLIEEKILQLTGPISVPDWRESDI